MGKKENLESPLEKRFTERLITNWSAQRYLNARSQLRIKKILNAESERQMSSFANFKTS